MGLLLNAVIGGLGSIAAASIQARSADRAAAEQRAAAQQAGGIYTDASGKAAGAAMTGYNYLTSGQGAQANKSYINNGMTANNSIAQLLGQAPVGAGASNGFQNYLNSTGYQFQLGQGMEAVTGNAASRGLLNSGGTAKALQQYGQNLSATTFGNYLQQLGGLSGAGQAGLNMTSGAGSYGGANAGQAYMSGAAGSANALTGGAYNAGVIGMQGADAKATGLSNALGSWLSAPWKPVGSA